MFLIANIVTSKALVTRSDALVPSSFLLLLVYFFLCTFYLVYFSIRLEVIFHFSLTYRCESHLLESGVPPLPGLASANPKHPRRFTDTSELGKLLILFCLLYLVYSRAIAIRLEDLGSVGKVRHISPIPGLVRNGASAELREPKCKAPGSSGHIPRVA